MVLFLVNPDQVLLHARIRERAEAACDREDILICIHARCVQRPHHQRFTHCATSRWRRVCEACRGVRTRCLRIASVHAR
jgi:hypothetical protein